MFFIAIDKLLRLASKAPIVVKSLISEVNISVATKLTLPTFAVKTSAISSCVLYGMSLKTPLVKLIAGLGLSGSVQ